MPLTQLTNLENEMVLIRLDQIACAYPSDIFSAEDGHDFTVATTNCTKICMIGGEELYVRNKVEEIFELSQQHKE